MFCKGFLVISTALLGWFLGVRGDDRDFKFPTLHIRCFDYDYDYTYAALLIIACPSQAFCHFQNTTLIFIVTHHESSVNSKENFGAFQFSLKILEHSVTFQARISISFFLCHFLKLKPTQICFLLPLFIFSFVCYTPKKTILIYFNT